MESENFKIQGIGDIDVLIAIAREVGINDAHEVEKLIVNIVAGVYGPFRKQVELAYFGDGSVQFGTPMIWDDLDEFAVSSASVFNLLSATLIKDIKGWLRSECIYKVRIQEAKTALLRSRER